MRRTLIVAVFVLLVAACSGDGSRGSVGVSGSVAHGAGGADGAAIGRGRDAVIELGRGDVVLTAGLVRFDDCGALLDYLHSESLARVGPYGFDDDGWSAVEVAIEDAEPAAEAEAAVAEAAAAPADAAPAAESASAAAPVEGVDFSGTNVQEAGVDEADIVKTDGRRIFTVSSGRLVVVDAADRSIVGSTVVAAGWGKELFIDGDSLLLITRSTGGSGDGVETVLQSFDVSGGAPEVMWTVNMQGEYVSARSVDGTVRVILRYDPVDDWFVEPYHESARDVAEASNRAAILDSTIDDWLPHYAFGSAHASAGPPLVGCGDVHAPSVFSGFGVTTVISVPVGGDFDPSQSTAVLAAGDIVYASTASLYVATTRWVEADTFDDYDEWRDAWLRRRTSIHRFDIAGAQATYEASGEVLGVIHNQFSLSEHNGYLRVVTTVSGPWGEDSESWVRVLSTKGDVLVEVGSVGDIGQGEDVQSVRFVGDIGYVVTFRQIDPFYTIDLSDPTNPEILGELKIPGFSSYPHPIGDTLVLGVGSDADEAGRITGAKVSLFDVSDLTEPREVAVWTAPDGWNDVGWDHRAFLWWAPEELAVIPVTVWNDWSGAVVLQVTDGAITEAGRVDHEIEGTEPGRTDCRRLTAADVPSAGYGRPIEDIVVEASYAVLACELGEAGMTGFECYYHDPPLTDDARDLDMLRGNERISLCRPSHQFNVIMRSIVINDELWTLSFQDHWGQFDVFGPARLHAHDLRTLNRVAALELAPDPQQAPDLVDDHGNRIAEATPTALPASAAGVLGSQGDVDVFVFDAAAGETYEIDVALGTLPDSTVTLYDPDGYQLAYNDDHSGTLASRLHWQATASGPHYVAVAGYSTPTSAGTYTLTITHN